MWWWFPRAWARGDAEDRAEYDQAKRRRELAEETAVGIDTETDIELGHRAREPVPKNTGGAPQVNVRYVPPVTPY